jgi:hypothetical protein
MGHRRADAAAGKPSPGADVGSGADVGRGEPIPVQISQQASELSLGADVAGVRRRCGRGEAQMWQRAVMRAQPRCRCGRAGGTVPYGYALMAAVSVCAQPCHICTGTWLGLTHKRRRRRSEPQRQCRRLQKRRTRPAIRSAQCMRAKHARARARQQTQHAAPLGSRAGYGRMGWAGMGCTAKAHCAHVVDRGRDSPCGCGCGGGTFERHTACCMLHATPYARFFSREAHHVDDRVREHMPLRSLVRAQQRLRSRLRGVH